MDRESHKSLRAVFSKVKAEFNNLLMLGRQGEFERAEANGTV